MELDSNSSQECQETEPFTGETISVETNIDATFKTTTQWTIDNGGLSTGEPRPSELMLEEVMLSLEDMEEDSEEDNSLSSDHTEDKPIKRSSGTTPTEETSDSTTRFA